MNSSPGRSTPATLPMRAALGADPSGTLPKVIQLNAGGMRDAQVRPVGQNLLQRFAGLAGLFGQGLGPLDGQAPAMDHFPRPQHHLALSLIGERGNAVFRPLGLPEHVAIALQVHRFGRKELGQRQGIAGHRVAHAHERGTDLRSLQFPLRHEPGLADRKPILLGQFLEVQRRRQRRHRPVWPQVPHPCFGRESPPLYRRCAGDGTPPSSRADRQKSW